MKYFTAAFLLALIALCAVLYEFIKFNGVLSFASKVTICDSSFLFFVVTNDDGVRNFIDLAVSHSITKFIFTCI